MSKQETRRKAIEQYMGLVHKLKIERAKLRRYSRELNYDATEQAVISKVVQARFVALLESAVCRVGQGHPVNPQITHMAWVGDEWVNMSNGCITTDAPSAAWLFLS